MIDLRPARYVPSIPLPERAFIPGRGPKPAVSAHVATVLPAERWRENEPYLWGVDLYNYGYAWEAHEAWEGPWRAAAHDETQAMFLQGLIQCAAARVKTSMGDAAAAQRLAERGLARLSRVLEPQGDRYMGLNIARYLADFARLHGANAIWLE